MTNPSPQSERRITRRGVLGAFGGAALVVAFHIPASGRAEAETSGFSPNAFVRIDEEGDVTLVIPQVEMGQGIYTGLAMVLAEELDADWSKVRVDHAPEDKRLVDWTPCGATFQRSGIPSEATLVFPDAYA